MYRCLHASTLALTGSAAAPGRRIRLLLVGIGLLALAGCPIDEPLPGHPSESCLLSGCHDRVEQIHYGGPALTCVACHGGNNQDPTKEGAHVTVDVSFNPSTPGSRYIGTPSLAELDDLSLDVIQFLNPSDYRVAPTTCGNSALGGADCHPDITQASLLLNRATLAGQLAGGGFIAGTQGKEAEYGIVEVADPRTPSVIQPGFVRELMQLPASAPDSIDDPVARAYFPVYEQLCLECHLMRNGASVPGLYYASGCSGCHMITENDSRAGTADATQDREELGHVSTHRFTNMIPDRQCAHCHVSHLGRALLAQGVRERSEEAGDEQIGGPNRGVEDPEDAVPWAQENFVRYQGRYELYGKPYPHFIEDEDGTNDVDETPPDVHTAAGMGCIDCHNIREAHGDQSLAGRMDNEIDVRCQSCHGDPGNVATLRSDAGLAFNRANTATGGEGINSPVFEEMADGTVQQHVRFTGALHNVTQITRKTDPAEAVYNPRTRMGCELHAGTAARKAALKAEVNALVSTDPDAAVAAFPGLAPGFVFPEAQQEVDGRVECFTCHNAWTINCYGCHMVRDDRESYVSALDGETKQGKVTSYGLSVVSDGLAMGFDARGRVAPMIGTSIFFTHIDPSGETLIDAVPLTDGAGNSGQGNVHNPVHHHTIRKLPRDCDGCHPSVTGSHDEDALKTAVGLGSGRYTFQTGNGETHLLDRLVSADFDGDGQVDDPVQSPLPTSVATVTPVVSTTHQSTQDPNGPSVGPGPLDAATITRILASPVTPQRPVEPEPQGGSGDGGDGG